MADDDGHDTTGIYDLRKDLRMSMIIAAFTGISWYIGAEINTSLFILFKRRRGLYFWSAALSSWGVVLQPLFIILADYGIWTDLKGSITVVYLTWAVMVIPQSWLLFSRLHLIAYHDELLRWLKVVLLVNSVVFGVTTVVFGIVAQSVNPVQLWHINLVWDRVQLTVFFVQETGLSLLYIWHTRKYLRDSSLLSSNPNTSRGGNSNALYSSTRPISETKQVLHHLVYINILVIALDIALLGVQYADMFYLQGAFKPCVYGIKLKVEFEILNRLIEMVRRRGKGQSSSYNQSAAGTGVLGPEGGSAGDLLKGKASSAVQTQQRSLTTIGGGENNNNNHDHDIGLEHLDGVPKPGSRSQSHDSHESQVPIWEGERGHATQVYQVGRGI
ncbi:hypothetical protein B0H63DRAFT_463328 [Podospora didyma]|uniref:DUF7703 domain-containing protein n=1 Tax=Podospora didyma TaxID=330526 RepID=A0AAE0NXB4_9PEZI|nr:hypothetical protein B0H63DRAFT_463328 [Podospora didyma]